MQALRHIRPYLTLIGFTLALALGFLIHSAHPLRFADQALYDIQTRWLRAQAPTPLAHDVVVIGLDEAAYETIPEPTVLWHRHLADLLTGLAQARPAVVGLATPLPVRSYNFLVENIDIPLTESLKRQKSAAPLVIGQPFGIGRQLRPIAPEMLTAAGADTIASLATCEDADGVVRRINQPRCRPEAKTEPLALSMARHLGRQGAASGMIDYTVGGPIDYTPIGDVLDWIRRGEHDRVRTLVEGRAVVIANLLPTETRHRLPVQLAAWEPGSRTEPGAVVHIQALRSLLAQGLIERVPVSVSLLLIGLASLFWFGPHSRRKTLLAAAVALALGAGSTYALWNKYYLPTATVLGCLLLAFTLRAVWDGVRQYRHKQALRGMLAGHVSPQVLRAILGGTLELEGEGQRCRVTLLATGIRGFSQRGEQDAPAAMIDLLNRFYAEAAAAIQNHGGAIDQYIGDGLVAVFGVPQPLDAPQRNALEAAQEILWRLERLNAELTANAQEKLQIGIGLHEGDVLAGYVGSPQHRDFSVIGAAVIRAQELQALTRQTAHPVLFTEEVAQAVGFAGGMENLGPLPLRDGTTPSLWGWTPPQPLAMSPKTEPTS
ncbi:MAG: CHASE2 domain-containing protein [Rugosibacter sp.]|nr:CHASE2 domain-containing protein [Rugosibacter sp.]